MFKLIVFDMDGVLVDIESSWEFLHNAFKVDGRDNFERYLNGEITYEEFMRLDIELWGKVHVNKIRKTLDQVPLMKGVEETISELKRLGYKTAIISSGLYLLAATLKKRFGINHVYANKLYVDENGILTGEGDPVVCLGEKAKVLKNLVQILGITTEQCAVIGDSIFDIPLFKAAGFSIAFNSENSEVKRNADITIKQRDLRKILPYFKSKQQNII
ncbi:MAG: HAD-IB family phosphatase [Candidatus Bathyarchaeota archaeon]